MDLTELDAPIEQVAAMPVATLMSFEQALDADADTLKRRKETFTAALVRRFNEDAKKALLAEGKDTGTVNIPASNSTTLKVTFPKKVEWDQKLLGAALNAMKPEEARHYAKVELKVDERKFTAAPPEVQQALMPARTVKVGKPTFSFKIDEAEAA